MLENNTANLIEFVMMLDVNIIPYIATECNECYSYALKITYW